MWVEKGGEIGNKGKRVEGKIFVPAWFAWFDSMVLSLDLDGKRYY